MYNFAPVMNDTMFKMLLTLWLNGSFVAKVLDVKTAFLHGKLEEELFIIISEGYQELAKEEGI